MASSTTTPRNGQALAVAAEEGNLLRPVMKRGIELLMLGLAPWASGGCGSDKTSPPPNHHGIEEPAVVIRYDHSPVTSTYLRILTLDLEWPRATYTEYPEDDPAIESDPKDFWVAEVEETTRSDGRALLTEELMVTYQEDSIPAESENVNPHCRIHVTLPPSLNNDYTIRLSENDTWSPETQALLDYLFDVYDQHAPEP